MRYAFNSPIQGTTEIVTMLMAWVAYAGMGYTLLKGQHMALAPCTTGRTAGSSIFSFFHLPAGHNPVCCHDQSVLGPVLGLLADQREVGGRRDGVCIHRKVRLFPGWPPLAIQGAFMTVYCAVGIARPNQVDPILIKSELPSEDELGAFGVEGTQNAKRMVTAKWKAESFWPWSAWSPLIVLVLMGVHVAVALGTVGFFRAGRLPEPAQGGGHGRHSGLQRNCNL